MQDTSKDEVEKTQSWPSIAPGPYSGPPIHAGGKRSRRGVSRESLQTLCFCSSGRRNEMESSRCEPLTRADW